MTEASRGRFLAGSAAVLLVVALFAGQAAADRLAPSGRSSAGAALGRTGFAYLTGLRTYAAAVLWSRLDAVSDDYYGNTSLGQRRFLLPSIRMATLLDPTLEDPYYVGPWILYEEGMKDGAEQLSREATARNPESALLHAGYAQLLVAERRFAEAAREADSAWRGKWRSLTDEYESLPVLEIAFDKTGQKVKADAVRAERARIEELARQDPTVLARPEE